jgi:chromosome segregation protein
MATWVFWLLIIVIIFLLVVILFRDKGIRGAIKNFFLRLKKKIHVARIKSKINKENEKKIELLRNLGEETWLKRVDVGFALEEMNKVGNLTTEKNSTAAEIEKLNGEIETHTKSLDEFLKKQEALMKEQEEKLAPLEKELSSVKKELHDWEKDVNEKEKLITKIEKKIAANREKIAEIEKDADLSKIEKQQNREEIEKTIKELESSRAQVQQELDPLRREQPGKTNKPGEIEPRVREFEERIKALKEEKKAEEKRVEEIIAGFRSKRNNQVARQTQHQKELDSLFEKIGEKVDRNRVENSDLAAIYAQIDNQNKIIADLEKQIKTEQQAEGSGG